MLSRPASQFSIRPFPLKIFHASAPCSSCRCCCRCCRRRLSNIYTRSPSLGRRKISGIPSHTQVSRILECTLHTQMIREIIKHFSSTEEGISHFTITSLSLESVSLTLRRYMSAIQVSLRLTSSSSSPSSRQQKKHENVAPARTSSSEHCALSATLSSRSRLSLERHCQIKLGTGVTRWSHWLYRLRVHLLSQR